MTTISYTKATVSCLPFIGVWVGLCNQQEVEDKITSETPPLKKTQFLHEFQEELASKLTRLGTPLPSIKISGKERTQLEEKVLICKKGRIYAVAAVAGNVLSIALIVSAFALRIFSNMHPIIAYSCISFSTLFAAGSAFLIFALSSRIHSFVTCTKDLNRLLSLLTPKAG